MCVDNNGIRHNCQKLVQWFEMFVVMAMNSGADWDSLPIRNNPDSFVVHADAAFVLAINNLPQLNSSTSYSTRSITKQHQFISRMPNFCSTIYLVSQIASLPGVEISYALVCQHRCNLRLLSVIFCLFQLGSWRQLLAQFDGLPSLRQRCYVFLWHATLSKMVALSMAAMELMVLANCSCVFVRAF